MKKSGVIAISLLSAAAAVLAAACFFLFRENRELREERAANTQEAWAELWELSDRFAALCGESVYYSYPDSNTPQELALYAEIATAKIDAARPSSAFRRWEPEILIPYQNLAIRVQEGGSAEEEALLTAFSTALRSLCDRALEADSLQLADLDSDLSREVDGALLDLLDEYEEPLAQAFLQIQQEEDAKEAKADYNRKEWELLRQTAEKAAAFCAGSAVPESGDLDGLMDTVLLHVDVLPPLDDDLLPTLYGELFAAVEAGNVPEDLAAANAALLALCEQVAESCPTDREWQLLSDPDSDLYRAAAQEAADFCSSLEKRGEIR